MVRQRSSTKAAALAALHAEIRQCERCPLWRTRTQAVPGAGSAQARIMFVGEAPGRQEDLRGEPFVGTAGRFFNEQLRSSGLSRSDVYITNVVKSRPFVAPPAPRQRPERAPLGAGRNRAPTAEEIAACRPWLDEQVRIIRPKIVVTLGQIALDHFLPGAKLAQMHGRPITRDGLTILPLYHPAMARYGGQWRRRLQRDFKEVATLLKRT